MYVFGLCVLCRSILSEKSSAPKQISASIYVYISSRKEVFLHFPEKRGEGVVSVYQTGILPPVTTGGSIPELSFGIPGVVN